MDAGRLKESYSKWYVIGKPAYASPVYWIFMKSGRKLGSLTLFYDSKWVFVATGIEVQKRLTRERFTLTRMVEEENMLGNLVSLFRKVRPIYEIGRA